MLQKYVFYIKTIKNLKKYLFTFFCDIIFFQEKTKSCFFTALTKKNIKKNLSETNNDILKYLTGEFLVKQKASISVLHSMQLIPLT